MATRGAKDGSGKGVGKKGGIRRNKNPTPCNDGTEKGTGKGTRRKQAKGCRGTSTKTRIET